MVVTGNDPAALDGFAAAASAPAGGASAAAAAAAASADMPSVPAPPNLMEMLPSGVPPLNLMLIFGGLLLLGMLGGVMAARLKWLPTITGFMALGLAMGPSGVGLLSPGALAQARVLVDIALGLILFKLGTSLHPVSALRDSRLVVTSLLESLLTFVSIGLLMYALGGSPLVAVIAAAIAVSSSPAVLIHVAREMNAEGPTLDTAETLVAANNLWSFVLFTLSLPVALYGHRFTLATAIGLPVYQLFGAVLVSLVVAWVATRIERLTDEDEDHYRFALVVGSVLIVLGACAALNVSSLLGALALGIACRWMESEGSRVSTVDLGGGGDVFFIVLFVFAGANLHLGEVWQYAPVALAFVVLRSLAKVAAVAACGRAFGQPARPSVATGLLLVPMAGLAIGLIQTTSDLVPELGARIGAIVLAAVAVFETFGPPIAAFAIRLAGEEGRARGSPAGGHGASRRPAGDAVPGH